MESGDCQSAFYFHCAMDDFCMENAGELQKNCDKKVLENYLPNVVDGDGWELARQIYADANDKFYVALAE